MRAQLSAMKMSDLRKHAVGVGCDADAIEEARDDDEPKVALVELIIANQSSQNGRVAAAAVPQPSFHAQQPAVPTLDDLSALEELTVTANGVGAVDVVDIGADLNVLEMLSISDEGVGISRAACDDLFAAIDRNGDGQLSRKEIKRGLGMINDAAGIVQSAKEVFKHADNDDSTSIDAAEFYDYMQRAAADGLDVSYEDAMDFGALSGQLIGDAATPSKMRMEGEMLVGGQTLGKRWSNRWLVLTHTKLNVYKRQPDGDSDRRKQFQFSVDLMRCGGSVQTPSSAVHLCS